MDNDALSQMPMTFKGVYFCLKRYLKLRFIFVLCLVLSLTFVHPFAVYADVNNLLIGTSSNALMALDLSDDEYGISLTNSIANVTNTVDYDYCSMYVVFKSLSDGSTYERLIGLDSSGHAVTTVPSGYVADRYGLRLYAGALPSPGVYSFSYDFASDFSVTYVTTGLRFFSKRNNKNASPEGGSFNIPTEQNSGDEYATAVVEVGALNSGNGGFVTLYNYFSPTLSAGSTLGGTFKVNFTKSSATPAYSTIGVGTSTNDYESGVSDSLSDLSSSVDTMTGEISGVTEAIQNLQGAMEPHYSNVLTQLHHITEQLHAFYDQVYNNIHLVELDILEGILAAIENMDLEVNVELGGLKQTIERVSTEIQANDNKLSAEQIASDEANTEEIKDAVEEHGNFIIDGLKGLFIPSDEFFKSYFDDLYEYFSDRFGFLSFPFDLLARFVDLVINSSDVDCVLTLPSFEIMGEQLLYENSFNLTEFLEHNFGFLLSAIRMGTSIILIMSFVQLCGDKWKEVMIR